VISRPVQIDVMLPDDTPFSFRCSPTSHVHRIMHQSGRVYEHDLLEKVVQASRPGTYVDVGAHIGTHSVVFAECCPSSRVIAIEPVKKNLEYLRQNVGAYENVEVLAHAAHEKKMASIGQNKTVPGALMQAATYPAKRLDDLLDDCTELAVLKIDVGGATVSALRSAEKAVSRFRPLLAIALLSDKDLENALDWVSERGYVCTWCSGAPSPHYIFEPYRVHVSVLGYNRPRCLRNVLSDFVREKRSWTTVSVYDDGSDKNMSAAHDVADEAGFGWTTLKGPHGKKRLWQVYNHIFAGLASRGPCTLFAFVPDDARLCREFFSRLVRCWNSCFFDKRVAMNIQAERYRDHHPCWTGFAPVRKNKHVWQTQWVDGAFVCNRDALDAVGWNVPKPNESRWTNPNISSGVWQWFTSSLHHKGYGMYRVHNSLIVHVLAGSVMHPGLRRKEPLVAARFADGDGMHARLIVTDTVRASLATIPSRVKNLEKVVASLLPQVHELRVFLNGYDGVPGFLEHERITVARSQDHEDRGDAGKFFWAGKSDGYEFTCDDDLIYPPEYVVQMLVALERFERRAVVGIHGVLLHQPITDTYYQNRQMLHWRGPNREHRSVHLLGTGCVAYHSSTIRVRFEDFEVSNMADIWLALLCQQQKIPMVCIARPSNWLDHLESPWTIYEKFRNQEQVQVEALKRIKPQWKIYKP